MLFRSTSALANLKGDITNQIAAAQQQSQQGDLLNMLMMMGMAESQSQPQEQIVYGQAPARSVSDIFGMSNLADLLRRRT